MDDERRLRVERERFTEDACRFGARARSARGA